MARTDWTELFLSAQGRIARGPFLIAAAVLLGALVFYEALVDGALHWLTGFFVYPALAFAGTNVLSKRFHDRGRTGWWAAAVLVAVLMVWPTPENPLDFVGLLVLVWAGVELAVMPSEQGANRFGPNPLRPLAAGAG